ncbi:bzip transcription factor 44 [Anaeramoeba ignava]|uniref:Bzip transcription factor 44 n=1 Tax=Anaeramoeba ignava TaxID=1746090 RepID=A0A9Q0LI20_ANAIG|nr:bzip transcription factor 44 [Anaeramoeba ignava]
MEFNLNLNNSVLEWIKNQNINEEIKDLSEIRNGSILKTLFLQLNPTFFEFLKNYQIQKSENWLIRAKNLKLLFEALSKYFEEKMNQKLRSNQVNIYKIARTGDEQEIIKLFKFIFLAFHSEFKEKIFEKNLQIFIEKLIEENEENQNLISKNKLDLKKPRNFVQKEEFEDLLEAYEHLKDQALKLKEDYDFLEGNFDKIIDGNNQLREKNQELEFKLNQSKNNYNLLLNSCKQSEENFQKQEEKWKQTVSSQEEQNEKIKENIKIKDEKIFQISKDNDDLKDEIQQLKSEINSLNQEISQIQSQQNSQTTHSLRKRIKELEEINEKQNIQIFQLQTNESKFESEKKKLKEIIKKSDEIARKNQTKIEELTIKANECDHYRSLVEDFQSKQTNIQKDHLDNSQNTQTITDLYIVNQNSESNTNQNTKSLADELSFFSNNFK